MCPSQYDCWIWNYSARFLLWCLLIPFVGKYICGFWFAYITVSLDLMVFYSRVFFSAKGEIEEWIVRWYPKGALNDFIHHLHLKQKATRFRPLPNPYEWLTFMLLVECHINIHSLAAAVYFWSFLRPCTTINENRAVKNY